MPITLTNPFKGRQFPGEVIVLGVRWYLRYPLAYERNLHIIPHRNGLFKNAAPGGYFWNSGGFWNAPLGCIYRGWHFWFCRKTAIEPQNLGIVDARIRPGFRTGVHKSDL